MKKTIIVDLDGTLANIDHRVALVRRKDKKFTEFYNLCEKDKVNTWCKELIMAMKDAGFRVMIVSARPKWLFMKTVKWLIKNGIESEASKGTVELHLLRDEQDYTPDFQLKLNWLKSGPPAPAMEEIFFVVDDRARVVQMWREQGLVCLQCADWEEFK